MRETFQVLVIPFIYSVDLSVAIFQRSDDSYWQFIAGGGENGEQPIEAAIRETFEEARISADNEFIKLDTVSSVPKKHFLPHRDEKEFWVIPEYCFAVKVKSQLLNISPEHKSARWVNHDEANSC